MLKNYFYVFDFNYYVFDSNYYQMVGDSLQVEITEEDKQKGIEDPDFSDVLPEEMQTKDIILTDFTDCDVYQCCDMPRNYNFFITIFNCILENLFKTYIWHISTAVYFIKKSFCIS